MTERHYFGTDGIRGVVGGEIINPEFMLRLGWSAGLVLANNIANAKVLIGKDSRYSCDVLATALASGLMSAGVDVALLGILPSPAIAHFTHSLQATAGVVISASHNGFQDNGVKFYSNQGCKLDDEFEEQIEHQLGQAVITLTPKQRVGTLYSVADVHRRYIEFCKQTFPAKLNLNGLNLSIDCANGATYAIAQHVYEELGASVLLIGNEPNGYNINQQCGSTSMHQLQTQVLATHADVGLAFDGDGDRLLMVDHQGKILDGDELLGILAYYHDNSQQDIIGVVGTAMSNLGLELALTQKGIAFERTAVGDRYVLERLLHKSWFLGGESSGHIINLHHSSTGDGIITALQILAIMQKTGLDLHTLRQVIIKRPQILINVPIKQFINLSEPSICRAVAHAEQQLKQNGRVLLRASGTEAVIRVMVEGDDELKVTRIAKDLAAQVELLAQ